MPDRVSTLRPEVLLTPQEFADALRWKLSTVYSKASRRELPAVHIGRSLRFRRSDVEKLIRDGARPALRPVSAPADPGDGEGGGA